MTRPCKWCSVPLRHDASGWHRTGSAYLGAVVIGSANPFRCFTNPGEVHEPETGEVPE